MSDPEIAGRWLRASAAFVWLATALLVAHPLYREIGAEYLTDLGLPVWLMAAACAAELVLGLWVAFRPATTADTFLQIGGIVFFTVVLGALEPALLAHPFGMLTKNLPMIAVIATAWLLVREGWTPRAAWVLRAGVAIIWITEGLFPKILFQQPMELDVVADSGLVPIDAGTFLILMGALQAASGVAVFVLRGRALRWLLIAQLVALIVLPALITLQDPSWWVHPFGPFIKNIPIIVATLVTIKLW